MKAVKMFIFLLVTTGVIYPLVVTLLLHSFANHQADGSLVYLKEKVIGSELVGQKFSSEKYFHGRPSSGGYNPLASGGSNLSMTSKDLRIQVEDRGNVPIDLLYASASGLDPHISQQAALYQLERVVKARNLNEIQKQKIKERILADSLVNVLEINLFLESGEL